MKPETTMHRPMLVRHARYRWDDLRGEHQVVFPEGVLVLNDSGAVIIRLCDGRSAEDVIAAVKQEFSDEAPEPDVHAFLERLVRKGLLCDAADS